MTTIAVQDKADTATKPTSGPRPIKPETRELTDNIKNTTQIKSDGTAIVDPETYVKNLPTGLTKEIVQDVRAYDTRFLAASALAVGELSEPVMKKHQALESVTAVFPMTGKDDMTVQYDRTRTKTTKDDAGNVTGTSTTYGAVSVAMHLHGTKNAGDFKKVKNMLTESALAAYGS
jgi:hypothetical protein